MATTTQDPLTPYVSTLKELYASMSQSQTSQHWTHLPRSNFIQLAMIEDDPQRHGVPEEERIRLAQLGKIETIMRNKIPIDLVNLFPLPVRSPLVVLPPPKRPRVLLIEGPPGGGKSTLALQICHHWAQLQDDTWLARFDIVILAYLRDRAIQKASTLAEILPIHSIEAPQTCTHIAKRMQESHGHKVLFIFDGWDEFPHELQKESLVSKIIRQPQKLNIHKSTVLITTRPVSSGNLLHIADQRVELLGYTPRQIHEYIESALDGKTADIRKLVQHLDEHPVIQGCCYVPLHAAILVHIFLTMKGVLPTTHHELFRDLVLCCIVRELETHCETVETDFSSLDDLPSDLKFQLRDLALLAFEGIRNDKVIFYVKDLQDLLLPTTLPPLGLIQAVEGLTLIRKCKSYNFFHLSVQELLAAYHISKLDSTEQVEVFERMIESSRFQAVLHYYSGFTKLDNPKIQKIISAYSQNISDYEKLLPLLHCFFEAQQPSLCRLVDSRFRTIQFDSLNTLNPLDYLAVGYFIFSLLSMSTSEPVYLRIRSIDGRYDCLKFLLNVLKSLPTTTCSCTSSERLVLEIFSRSITSNKCKLIVPLINQIPAISTLIIHNTMQFVDGLVCLAETLQTNSSLRKLQLTKMDLCYTEEVGVALSKMLHMNKSLKHLDLSLNKSFLGSEAYSILEGLRHNTTLLYFNLSDTGMVLKENTVQMLSEVFKVNETLTHLDMSNNVMLFSDSNVHYIFNGLQSNTTLAYLNLCKTGIVINTENAEALKGMVDVNTALTHLDLSLNQLSCLGANSIFYGLQNNMSLSHLNLSYTNMEFTENTAEMLTKTLDVNKTLTHLNLSGNRKVSDKGAGCLFQALQCNSALVHLNLTCTRVTATTTNTAQALTKMLEVNKALKQLNLSSNLLFSGSGAKCIFQGLKLNITLVYLNLSYCGPVEGSMEMTSGVAQALAEMVRVNKALKKLNLSRNKVLSDLGACCIFQSLHKNNTLSHLNLCGTRITLKDNTTAQAFAHMLKMNKTLTHLNVSSNMMFSDLGPNRTFSNPRAHCVFQALKQNSTLVSLNLANTGITDEAESLIAQTLNSHKSLTMLNISFNGIGVEGFTRIVNSLKLKSKSKTLYFQTFALNSTTN